MPTDAQLIDHTQPWESWGIAARWNPQHGWHDPTLTDQPIITGLAKPIAVGFGSGPQDNSPDDEACGSRYIEQGPEPVTI